MAYPPHPASLGATWQVELKKCRSTEEKLRADLATARAERAHFKHSYAFAVQLLQSECRREDMMAEVRGMTPPPQALATWRALSSPHFPVVPRGRFEG